ncbi:hypothetical protein GLOTRDRAFT_136016 [Gloeophyllum trabeum ATCC 11539]|uniref:Uncharacterized protein n=1 Tax=Gloeophyllum trabeum (strain ATCC 11539 / FP-39264 / Madison 617) TaxID=670483 RepID=S7S019_GLOTA|nr:uncharacterized protein GLOTRDRAFT_136016 [Gloeophyllum trabeum ATCC 11539]EPQ59029.1 hypothetical protein GLOTRDRAFT_136016 [Gloeophyllum trabeum ATCC 11539]
MTHWHAYRGVPANPSALPMGTGISSSSSKPKTEAKAHGTGEGSSSSNSGGFKISKLLKPSKKSAKGGESGTGAPYTALPSSAEVDKIPPPSEPKSTEAKAKKTNPSVAHMNTRHMGPSMGRLGGM